MKTTVYLSILIQKKNRQSKMFQRCYTNYEKQNEQGLISALYICFREQWLSLLGMFSDFALSELNLGLGKKWLN